MAKVLVINPYITDFKLYDEWMHPLGLYHLLAFLKKNGHEIYFFNCLQQTSIIRHKKFGTGAYDSIEIERPDLYKNINRKYKRYGCPEGDLRTFLHSIPHPDQICLGGMMTYWAPGILNTAKIIREIFPDTPIILGGIAAQLIPEYFQQNINNCTVESSFQKIPQLINNSAQLDFLSTESFIDAFSFIGKTAHGALLLSLGCPLQCSYCASKTLQPRFIQRPLSAIIKEIDYLVSNMGVSDFAFYDDALLYRPEDLLYPMLDYIKSSGFQLRFHTPNGLHLRYVNETLAERLKESGFTTLRFGYESGAVKHQNDTGSKIFSNEVAQKIAILLKSGFKKSQIGIYIMAGLRDQYPSEVLHEMEFISSLNVNVKPVFLSPVPRTPLFSHYAKQFPQLISDPLWHNDSFFITQLPGWDADAVEEIRLKARALNAR